MNKSLLLDQLAIARQRPPPRRTRVQHWALGTLLAGCGCAALAVTAWLLTRPGEVAITTEAAQAMGRGGDVRLEATGYVAARRAATVSSKVTGKLAAVLVEEGQDVAAGQVIARLDDTNIRAQLDQARAQARAAESAVALAETELEGAEPRYRRSERLHQAGFLSDQAVEDSSTSLETARRNVELARRQLEVSRAGVEVARQSEADTVIRAPFSGVLTVKAAQPGEMVSPTSAGGGFTRTGIGTIVDMESLQVDVDVSEGFISRVRPGMPANVQLNAYPDWIIPAEVAAVIPTADRAKATVGVHVALAVRDPRIVPDMAAKVSFLTAPTHSSPPGQLIVVPVRAIIRRSDGSFGVFVIEGGRAHPRRVEVGQGLGSQQVIQRGLQAGEVVAVDGALRLRAGTRVRVRSAD